VNPPRCPLCRSVCIPIHYGPITPRIAEQARRGEIKPGGRVPIGRGWWCPSCDEPVVGPGDRDGWAVWQ
jgi:hypothetical protein